MSPWIELIDHPLVQRAGWTLLHFVWQGTAIALVWGIARTLLHAHSPRARYLVACLLMGSMAVAPILTFRLVDSSSVPARFTIAASGYEAESVIIPPPRSPDSPRVPTVQDLAKSAAAGLERALPWFVVFWWIGVCALSVRLLHGFWQVRRMASRLTRPLTDAWQDRFRELQRRLRMSRPVLLLESAAIEIPAVVGWLRPVVLVPASSLSGLTPTQLELILAHELAHIRRHDHWVNLFQVLIETVLFYHPAVWWLSRDIRRERELCCDDLAVSACGNRLAYARALSALEGLRHQPEALAMGAGDGSLLERIRHIAGLTASGSPAGWRRPLGNAFLGMGLLLFLGGLGCLAWSTHERAAVSRIAYRGWSEQAPQVSYRAGSVDQPRTDPMLGLFLQTEIARMVSRPFLTQVADRSGLASRWANGDGPLTSDAVVERLRRQLDVRRVPDSALIEIRVATRRSGAAPHEAAELANSIAQVYCETRLDMQTAAVHQGINTLQQNLNSQEASLNQLQSELDDLKVNLWVSDSVVASGTLPAMEPETARRMQAERINVKAQFTALNELLSHLTALQTRNAVELRRAMLTAHPDTELGKLLSDLWFAEASLAKLNVVHGPEHPEVRQISAMLKSIDRNIDDRIDGILKGLRLRVEVKQAEFKALDQAILNAANLEAETAERYGPYFAKRRDLENVQRMRDVILLRILQEKTDAAIPPRNRSDFEVIEPAVASDRAPQSHGYLGTALCAAGLLSTLTGLVLRMGPRGGSPAPE